jgi:hypothetical protein
VQFVFALLDDSVACFGDVVPGAGEVAEGLGDDDSCPVGESVQKRVVRARILSEHPELARLTVVE